MSGAPARSYFIRTFGCQMNEHDSERLAGVLEADGLVAAEGVEDADVVVLNTCCIRENADNRLYGTLGHLKAVKDRRPGMQIAVGGCLAQKDGEVVRRRAPWVDAVWGTHNVSRAADLLTTALDSPVTEIVGADEGDEPSFASALPVRRDQAWAAWVTIQVGCDNNCAFCIVPSVRGPEASRRFADVVDEVRALAAGGTSEVTLLGQNVNSYGRDLTTHLRTDQAWRDAAALVGSAWTGDARPRARALFADLLRAVAAVDGISRVRFTSPHPKDLRDDVIAAMAEEAAVCEHLHFPLQSGSDLILATMHRGYSAGRYLEKLAAARAGIADLAVTTDIIVGFPGETEDDFADTLAVAAEAGFDSAYTFIYSPRTGTEAAAMTEQYVPAPVVAERFERLRVVVERSALRRHVEREGREEEVLVEGPSRRDPAVTTGRTRQNKLVHFPAPAGSAPAGSTATVLVTRGAPHHLEGRLVEVTAAPRHRTRIPVSAGLSTSEVRHLALVGPTASGKSAVALEVADRLGDVEIVVADSMQVYRGMDVGTASPGPDERAAVVHHLLDVADPWEDYHVGRYAAAARLAVADIERRGLRALLVGGSGLYVQAVVDGLEPPGTWPHVREMLEADPDTGALFARLQALDPPAAARIEPGNRRRVVRALEVCLGAGRPFSSYGPGMTSFPRSTWRIAALWSPRDLGAARIASRFATMLDAGLVEEVRALVAAPLGMSRTARQALGYREVLRHLEGGEPLEAMVDEAVRRTVAFARRQRVWWRRDPRPTWIGTVGNPLAATPVLLGDWVVR